MKKIITIITALLMVSTIVACSPVAEKVQPETPEEITETSTEVPILAEEIIETSTESPVVTDEFLKDDDYSDENMEKGQELAVLAMETLFNYNEDMDPSQNIAILEEHMHSKTAYLINEFITENAKNESYVTPTMDYKERHIVEVNVPMIDAKKKIDAAVYTFTINRVVNGIEEGTEDVGVLLKIEDGKFKVLGFYNKEA